MLAADADNPEGTDKADPASPRAVVFVKPSPEVVWACLPDRTG
jgi:hypothetical protein